MSYFSGRNLLIVTMHSKERVLKPLLERELKVKCTVTSGFNTDFFGMFSGEVNRKEDALTTVREKCLAAMSLYNFDLAVASEGSFGPHPAAFFASADEELVILIDLKEGIEIVGKKLSMKTNFNARFISDKASFLEFLEQIHFPSHGIILKDSDKFPAKVYKEITCRFEASRIFDLIVSKYGKAFVETDMRALNNPSRMQVIQDAAEDLVEKVNSLCSNCQFPGFSVKKSFKGLPCSSCKCPTESTLYHLKKCANCDYEEKKYFPRNIRTEDPMYCDNCNP